MSTTSVKTLKIGIAALEDIKKRTMDIAKGTYKPKSSDPKIWFTSLKALSNILTPDNKALLRAIIDTHPQSISELAKYTGRNQSNVTRTLKTMEKYGFVKLSKAKSSRGKDRIVPQATSREMLVRQEW